jgi:hypothetical protein
MAIFLTFIVVADCKLIFLQLFWRDTTLRLYNVYPFLGYVLRRCTKPRAGVSFAYTLNASHCCRLTYAPRCHHMYHMVPAFTEHILIYRSRDSAVGITTCYRLGDRGVGVRVPVGSRIFSTSSRLALGSYPASYPVGTVVTFPGVKAAGA